MSTITRRDGRKISEIRTLRPYYDSLSRVDGSARFYFGDTGALASISGPIEVRLAVELPSKATFEVNVRPLANVPGTDSKLLSTMIRSSLEPSLILTKNPRTLVQLVIQSLTSPVQNSIFAKDSITASMINASTLAFLNACSIPMKGVVAAVAVGCLSSGDLILDPSEEESETMTKGGVFAFMFSDNDGRNIKADCVWTNWRSAMGKYNEKELFEGKEMAKIGARQVYNTMRARLGTSSSDVTAEAAATAVPLSAEETTDEELDDNKMEI